MKKIAVVSLASLFILASGTIGYSQDVQFRMSGYLDVLSQLNVNVPAIGVSTVAGDVTFGGHPNFYPNGLAYNKAQGYMESRFRLKFEAMLGKDVSGVIWFEGDAERWGGTASGTQAQRNILGHWGADRAGVEVKNFYIQFGLPYLGIPVPINIIAGVQPYAVRPGIYTYTDGPGILASAKIDPVQINVSWFKPEENESWAADDADIYSGEIFANIQTFKIGTYLAYWNMNSYPIHLGAYPTFIQDPADTANFYFAGLYGDGKAGPVNLQLDFLYDWGKVKNQRTTAPDINYPDVKYGGWAARGLVDYPWEMFSFAFTGMYATGSDLKKTSAFGLPGNAVADPASAAAGAKATKVGANVTPPESENSYLDSLIIYASPVNRRTSGYFYAPKNTMGGGAYSGTWFAKLSASWKATPWYKATLYGLYIGDTTKHGNTFGTAKKGGSGSLTTASPFRDDGDIGWEFDLINEFQIYKNLKWSIGLGYLIAGDALDYFDSRARDNVSPKNPWVLTTSLIYTF